MNKVLPIILTIIFSLSAQALFEVKDASDNTVLEISNDGLRVFNLGDTLMVISSSEIKAFIDSSTTKALSRSFSVTTSAASGKDALSNAFEVTTRSAQFNSGLGRYTDFSPDNIFIGLNAGSSAITGASNNVFVGNNAGFSNDDGHSNTFIGPNAGYNNTGWHFNTYIGSSAGYNSNGSDNTFVGCAAGYWNETGQSNAIFGDFAGLANKTGNDNSLFGHGAGIYYEGGNENTIMGSFAGRGDGGGGSTASYNCIFGSEAGTSATGDSNVMLGRQSGFLNLTGSSNVFLGNQAGYSETGSNKLYISNSDTSNPLVYGDFGTNYLRVNGTFYVTGATTINDYLTLDTGTNVSEFSTDGTMGSNSDNAVPTERAVRTYVTNSKDNLGNHTATQNIRLSGYYLSNDGGNEGVYVDTGGDVGIGTNSPGSNRLKVMGINGGVTGAAGYFENTNTSTGIGLAAFATSGDAALYAEQKNTISTTANIVKFASRYGGSWHSRMELRSSGRLYTHYLASGTGTYLQITSGNEIVKYSSSKKYKKDIFNLSVDYDKFMQLRPVSFKWNEKSATENKPDYGLIAEDIEKIDPELATYDIEGNIEGVNYQKVNIMLLKVVQDQQNKLKKLENEIEEIKKLLNK